MDTQKTGANIIRSLMKSKNVSMKQLADLLGYTSAQVLSNKLYRDALSLNEYVKIANALDCDVKTISRDGTMEIINQCKSV